MTSDRARFLESILADATDYAIFTTDQQGRVTGWNSGAERVFGWSEGEILGREAEILFTDQDRRAGVPTREMARARATGQAPDERWHRRKDGRQFWATGSMMRLVDDDAEIFEGYLKILRDRTAERIAEERRRSGAAFMPDAPTSSGDCIKVLDLDAKFVFMNEDGMAAMEVGDIDAVLDVYWPDLWPGEGRAAAEAAAEAARAGGAGRFQGFCPTLAGKPKWWDVQVTPIRDPQGKPERLLCISRDMTESTLADRTLAMREARWRGLFERMQEGFFLAEAIRDAAGRMVDFRFLETNPAFEAQTGLMASETIGRTAREAIPAISATLIDIYARVVDCGEPKTFEIHVEILTGRWYEARARKESDDRFAVLFLDITERKLAAEALVASEERLRRAQTAGHVGTFELNIATDALTVSSEFCRIFGLAPAETLPLSDVEVLVLAEDRHLVLNARTRRSVQAPLDVEYRVRRPSDGALAWIARRAKFSENAEGHVDRVLGTVQDITARKTAESESRKLASIVEQSEDFIGIALPDGRLDFVNAAGRRIVGLPGLEAARPTFIADYVAPEDEAIMADIVRPAIRSEGVWQGELSFRNFGSGSPTPMLCDIFPVKSDGTMVGYGIVARELTERKKAEKRHDALIQLGDRLGGLDDKAEMAFVAAEIMGRTLKVDRAGYGEVDLARETIAIERDWSAAGVPSVAGVLRFADYGFYLGDLKSGEPVVIVDASQDPRTASGAIALMAIQARAFINLPIMEGGRCVALFYLADARPRVWSAEEVSFIRNIAERTRAAVERLRAAEQQLILNHELSHRMKNMLAMVQSIATQTLRNAASVEVARDALSARLVALGKAHDVLVSGEQDGAGIVAIVSGTVKLHGDNQPGRFRLAGPNLEIGARAALPLALMLHELATNAVKYGALSTERGHITIAWGVVEAGRDPNFSLTWSEHEGPSVAPPERKGFGSRLIERALAGQFGGDVVLAFEPAGVVCRLTAPLARLQAEE